MKFSHSIVKVVLASVLFIGCKETASKPKEIANSATEIAVATKPETATIHVEGMTCAIGCAKAIEDKLSKMNGVQQVKVDFDKKEATINFDLDKLSSADLVKAIESTGDGESYKTSEVKLGNKA